jgi:hypothetical protein
MIGVIQPLFPFKYNEPCSPERRSILPQARRPLCDLPSSLLNPILFIASPVQLLLHPSLHSHVGYSNRPILCPTTSKQP